MLINVATIAGVSALGATYMIDKFRDKKDEAIRRANHSQ
jgi:hypothetical protein